MGEAIRATDAMGTGWMLDALKPGAVLTAGDTRLRSDPSIRAERNYGINGRGAHLPIEMVPLAWSLSQAGGGCRGDQVVTRWWVEANAAGSIITGVAAQRRRLAPASA